MIKNFECLPKIAIRSRNELKVIYKQIKLEKLDNLKFKIYAIEKECIHFSYSSLANIVINILYYKICDL